MSLSVTVKNLFKSKFGKDCQVVSFAPGRVEFIGNHTDYNQGSVIGAAIDLGVFVALARVEGVCFRFSSSMYSIVDVLDPATPISCGDTWVNYPLGVYNALLKRGLKVDGAFEMSVESDLPSGSGLSSSAALELATAVALNEAYGLGLSNEDLAIVCREAENEFVGVPCGILDQGVSACGRKGELVHIDCRMHSFSTLKLGAEFSIWVFNTHKKHSLVESMYEARHDECFEAARLLGVDCLADITVEQFLAKKLNLPEDIAKRAEHVIFEIERVKKVKTLLTSDSPNILEVGALLVQSHISSRDLFENSIHELDYLVGILDSMPGVLGARLTGGGFGGAAMALVDRTFTTAYAESVAAAYRGMFGESPQIIHCNIGAGARLVEV